MCTAIFLHRVFPSHPVVVAGNRDEWLARPALAPHEWTVRGEGSPVRIFAGKDQREGGTWFGVNQYGLVVGVTNRYTGTRDEDRASRGQLVLKCLAQDSVQDLLTILTPEEATRYIESVGFCNPHMLVKDERKMNLRRQFFKEFFALLETYVVNTSAPVLEAHRTIK